MILAVYRDTFSFAPQAMRLPEGETLAAMRGRMLSLPDDFDLRGVICINGHPVPRDLWGMVRPKPVAVTEVTFHLPPQGGGGDGDSGKNIFATIASIALTVVSGGIAGGTLLGGLTGAAAAGGATVASLALAAGVSLVGSLLLSALVPPPSVAARGKSIQDPGSASAEGNMLEPNGAIPRVFGERKVFPPLACEPFTYFDGPDEVVEAIYVLAGPHQITDIRVGAAAIDGLNNVEYETREGWPGDLPISMVERQARTEVLQSELRGYAVDANDGRTLESPTGDFSAALPQPITVATRDAPDEHLLHLVFPGGINKNASDTDRLRVPLRLRIRQVGSTTWRNLPELHFSAATPRQMRATIKLVWSDSPSSSPGAAVTEGWVEAQIAAPAEVQEPAGDPFSCNGTFFAASGDSWMNASNLGTTRVKNVVLTRYMATILLDTSVFPKGRYEIEIVRGQQVLNANWSSSAYTVSGTIWDLFAYAGTPPRIAQSRNGISDSVVLLRSVSVWNEHPLPSSGLALISVRARNRAVDRLSCVAGGWVLDWDGTGWNEWTVTDNPAPHLRDIWVGAENLDPVPLDLVDDAGLVSWRQHCIDMGYTCNALIEDQSLDDAARIVASCGYAKPVMSDIYSVAVDRDRSAEAPVQLFTQRNMSGFQWTKGFARVPDGFRVNFRDASRDYDMHQVSVFRPGSSDDSGRMEQVTLEGIVHEADAIRRAEYDQMQAQLRSTFYSWDCAAESILCRRGDLIAVQHDMLTEWAGAARIVDVVTDIGGDVVAIRVDAPLPVGDYPYLDASANLANEVNLALMGLRSGVAIRRATEVSLHPISSTDGALLEFSPAIDPEGINVGDLAAVGPMGQEYLRLIVFGVSPRPNFEATVTAVDEAPQLWN